MATSRPAGIRAVGLGLLVLLGAAGNGRGDEVIGIGAALGTVDGQIVVGRITPDSPAAANKALKVGDRIVAIAQNDDAPVSMKGKVHGDAVNLIRGRKGTTVRLTIVAPGKDDSEARVVSFVREDLTHLLKGTPQEPTGWGDGVPLAVGSDAPNIELTPLGATKPEHLADFRGKVIVLKFWSTWCAPCQQAMADLQSYGEKYPAWRDKVVLIAVSVDEEEDALMKFLKTRGWGKTHNVRVETDALRAFHVGSLPSTYVIDAQGKVVVADSAQAIPATVNRLLRPD
jgi:thiol-disulfide isomerase/thioredoxin